MPQGVIISLFTEQSKAISSPMFLLFKLSNKTNQPLTKLTHFKKNDIIHLLKLRSLSTPLSLLSRHKMCEVTILTFTKCDCKVPCNIIRCKRIPATGVYKCCPVYKRTDEERTGDCGTPYCGGWKSRPSGYGEVNVAAEPSVPIRRFGS